MDDKTLENRVRQFLETGQKIEAIKFVRENSELDLKGAKQYVERLAPKTASPPTATNGVGWLVVALLILLVMFLVRWWNLIGF